MENKDIKIEFEERIQKYYDKRREFLTSLSKETQIGEKIIHTRYKITLFDKFLLWIMKIRKLKVAIIYFDKLI